MSLVMKAGSPVWKSNCFMLGSVLLNRSSNVDAQAVGIMWHIVDIVRCITCARARRGGRALPRTFTYIYIQAKHFPPSHFPTTSHTLKLNPTPTH